MGLQADGILFRYSFISQSGVTRWQMKLLKQLVILNVITASDMEFEENLTSL